jgi:hypothetical protein
MERLCAVLAIRQFDDQEAPLEPMFPRGAIFSGKLVTAVAVYRQVHHIEKAEALLHE